MFSGRLAASGAPIVNDGSRRPLALTVKQVALGRRLTDKGKSIRKEARVIFKCHPTTPYGERAKKAAPVT